MRRILLSQAVSFLSRTAYVLVFACGVFFAQASSAAMIAGFEDLALPGPETFQDGTDRLGGFASGGAFFTNTFTDFGGGCCASGWSYANVTDATTPGFTNQNSTIAGAGFGGSEQYAVAQNFDQGDARIVLPEPTLVSGAYLTNTTYVYLAVLNGDDGLPSPFIKGPFGDDPATKNVVETNVPDWLLLEIIGKDENDAVTGSIDFYLADYRFANDADDFVRDDWTWVDMTSLGEGVKSLEFAISSTDTGDFGTNTPTYFALDEFTFGAATPLPGDANGDGVVDLVDLNDVRNNFGAVGGAGLPGDANRDGVVDLGDLNDVRNNFGAGVLVEAPEPGSLVLAALAGVMIGGVGVVRGRARRRRQSTIMLDREDI